MQQKKQKKKTTKMNRRIFIGTISSFLVTTTVNAAQRKLKKLKKFHFRIKTKDGNIVGNVTIEAFDVESAKCKLKKRYPDCEILNVNYPD